MVLAQSLFILIPLKYSIRFNITHKRPYDSFTKYKKKQARGNLRFKIHGLRVALLSILQRAGHTEDPITHSLKFHFSSAKINNKLQSSAKVTIPN